MKNFQGTYTALITPFKNNKIDFTSMDRLLKQQLDAGVSGFVVNGTTAESPTLEAEEVEGLYKHIRKFCGPDVELILGTGSNSTAQTIAKSKKAEALGADGLLVVVPYYNKPPQRGLEAHFKAVAEAVKLPLLLYNVPGRTVTSLSADTILALSKVNNIVGIKEASGKIDFLSEIKRLVSSQFSCLSGDDGTYVDFLAAGGHGVISVASHVIPKQIVLWKSWVASGETAKAKEDIHKYSKLIDLLFVDSNPIPVKKALQIMGIIEQAEVRLPLVELSNEHSEKLKAEMKSVGLL